MSKSRKRKSSSLVILLIILLLGISAGYAAFAQNLYIRGTATASGSFSLIFSAASADSNSTYVIGKTSSEGDTLTIAYTLPYPGASSTVTATITNTGNISAKLQNTSVTFSYYKDEACQNAYTDSELASNGISFTPTIPTDAIAAGGTANISLKAVWTSSDDSADQTKPATVYIRAELNYVQNT